MIDHRFTWWVAQTIIGDRLVRVERQGDAFAAWFGPHRADGNSENSAVLALVSALGWMLTADPVKETARGERRTPAGFDAS